MTGVPNALAKRRGGAVMVGLIVMLALAVGLATCPAGPARAQGVLPAQWRPLTLGLHTGPDPLRIDAYMPVAAALGAAVVPIEFPWERVEPAPDQFAWEDYDPAVRRARTHGLVPIGVLVYPAGLPFPEDGVVRSAWPVAGRGDWLYFVERVVARYAWAIRDWVVVRDDPEDADPLLWASEAAAYARFLQDTAAAIRRAQPEARVRVAANAADLRWLEVFIREGGLEGTAGLVLDVNRWPAPPEGLQVVIGEVRALALSLGHDPELWVWRLGYPTHAGVSQSAPHRTGVTEEQQAQYLVRSHVLLAHAGVELILWHELMDSGWEPNVAGSNFGLWRRDGQAKPAAVAYRTLASRLGGRTYGLPQPSPSLDTDDVTVEALAVVLAALRERLSGSPILLSVAVHPFAGAPGDSLVVVIWVGANPPPAAPVAAISRDELALPRGVRFKVSDWSGAPMGQLVVGPEPVYLEIIPVPVVQSPPGGPDAVMMLE